MAVSSSVAFESAPTIEEVLRECDNAWEYACVLRGRQTDASDDEARASFEDDVYVELARAHSSMNQTYPVILAAMAAGNYDRRAASKFLHHVQDHPWKSEEEFLDTQSTYSSFLYRAKKHHTDSRMVVAAREQTRAALLETQRELKSRIERLRIEADANNHRRAQERLRDFTLRVASGAVQRILLNGDNFPTIVTFDEES